MTGDTTSKTTTVITTARTASEAHGTGADITPHGIHGISLHGDITAGTTLGIMVQTGVGMTLGTTAVTGEDGMTRGTILITDGTIHTGATTIITTRATCLTTTRTCGTDQGIRQDLTGYSEAHLRSEEASGAEVPSAGMKAPEEAQLHLSPGPLRQEDQASAGLQL